jgi:acyl-coenzyme A thioesterase PaaI-like protein
VNNEARAESARLADQLRRIINRLAVVRPAIDALRRASDVAAGFADTLDQLPERQRSWEVSEAGLLPRDFLDYSPISGRGNPIAPPLRMRVIDAEDTNRIIGSVTFGPAYEGPPGHVHGGFIAAMFDELLGFAQLAPGFTAYLHVDYRKPTPLNADLALDAFVDRVEGRKRFVRGVCRLGDTVLAEAEGLFIGPRSGEDYLAHLGLSASPDVS